MSRVKSRTSRIRAKAESEPMVVEDVLASASATKNGTHCSQLRKMVSAKELRRPDDGRIWMYSTAGVIFIPSMTTDHCFPYTI